MTERIETLEQATRYLDGLINRERSTDYAYRRLDLQPIEALLDGLDRPQDALSIVHVAGSKGKGSTCLFAEALLMALGERVGTFTSPHLECWTERFRVGGRPIAEAALVRAVERVRPVVERLRVGPEATRPSFFDATTAVALWLFRECAVDRVLLEVGLGGRLDSTNVVAPAVTCVTSIELEHTDKLGDTEAAIAGEKAGILKPGVPAIVGLLRPEAMAVVEARAREVGAPWVRLADESADGADERLVTRVGEAPLDVEMATPGRVARTNARLAIECVRALGRHTDDAVARAAASAFAATRLPARCEVLPKDPRVVIDAAHTAESSRALAEALRRIAPEGYDLVLSVSADKAVAEVLAPLLPRADRVIVTCAEPSRSIPTDVLAARVEAVAADLGVRVRVEEIADPRTACRRARATLAAGRMLCVAGSIYMAGAARSAFGAGAPPMPMAEIAIGPARPDDVGRIPEIERRAATLFPDALLPAGLADETTSDEALRAAQAEGRLLVARDVRDGVIGFALLEDEDAVVHLEEIDVDPAHGRRGIGRALVDAALAWAASRGASRMTLSTFRDVAWNAPFYARCGFEVVPSKAWSEADRQRRAEEAAAGLDVSRRVIMARALGPD